MGCVASQKLCYEDNSQWVAIAVVEQWVPNVDLCSTDPVWAAVPSVGNGDVGDVVGLAQVHPPPGVDLCFRVAAGPLQIPGAPAQVNGIVGSSNLVPLRRLTGYPASGCILFTEQTRLKTLGLQMVHCQFKMQYIAVLISDLNENISQTMLHSL